MTENDFGNDYVKKEFSCSGSQVKKNQLTFFNPFYLEIGLLS